MGSLLVSQNTRSVHRSPKGVLESQFHVHIQTLTNVRPHRTLSQFHGEPIHVLSFFHGTGIFLLTFCISMALGVIFGLSCSLMLKHSELGTHTNSLCSGQLAADKSHSRPIHRD